MIGLGLGGGGGGADYATTIVSLAGVDAYSGGLMRMARGWDAVYAAQSRAARAPVPRASDRNAGAGRFMGNAGAVQGGAAPSMSAQMAERMGGGGQAGGSLQRLGLGLTGLSVSMIGLGVSAVKAGNDVYESESLVANTFGANTSKIKAWSEERRNSFGVNAYAERAAAASFQNLFTAGGLDPNKAAAMSESFVQARGDLVSFYNVADKDVLGALQSGVNGESEPLRRFGIYLSEASTNAYAYAHGIAATNAKLTEQQKLQARAGFILESFTKSKAHGDLDATKDSPSNQIRRLNNERDEALADLGTAFIPIEQDGIKLLRGMVPPIQSAVKWFAGLDATTRKWTVGLGLAAGPLTFLAGKGLSLAAAWKTLKGGGGAATGAAGADSKGGSPLDSIKDKLQSTLTDAIKTKLGLGDAAGGSDAGKEGTSVHTMHVKAHNVYLSGPITGGAGGAGVGAAGAGAAGAGAGGGALAGLTAFGMGPLLTGAIIATGTIAAYKSPGYMRDARSKSDEDMAASSDPIQHFHAWAGRKSEMLMRPWNGGAEKVAAGDKAEKKSHDIYYHSKAWQTGHSQRQWLKDLPKTIAASDKWYDQNVKGWSAMRAIQERDGQRLSQIDTGANGGNRLRIQSWARENFGKRLGANYMRQWDKDNTPPERAAGAKPARQDWNPETVRLAAAFGQGPGTSLQASSSNNRDDTTTVTIGARPADQDHRSLRARNMVTPRRLP